jgi:endonuclease/exonuclease/phosphatase family metal-dependent hydrolase
MAEPSATRERGVVVASFNAHCGVDGWARRFDLTAACAVIDADVLVLQENWAPDGGQSLAGRAGGQLGYEVFEVAQARGGVLDEDPALARPFGPSSWAPRFERRCVPRALLLDAARRRSGGSPRPPAPAGRRRPGSWGLAVLSRLPVRRVEVLDLRQVPRDPARRRAIVAELACGLTVTGTHLAHLENGSPLQMRQLALALRSRSGPQVLTGDMNSWSFPLLAMLPGWRKAVRGPTWPAAFPTSQIDHLLVTNGARAGAGEVLGRLGSDHLPIRARVRF